MDAEIGVEEEGKSNSNNNTTSSSWTNSLQLPSLYNNDPRRPWILASAVLAATTSSIPIIATITAFKEENDFSLSWFECGICISAGEFVPLLYKLGYVSKIRQRVEKINTSLISGLVSLSVAATAFSPPVVLFVLLRILFSVSWIAIRMKFSNIMATWRSICIQFGFLIFATLSSSVTWRVSMLVSASFSAIVFLGATYTERKTSGTPYLSVASNEQMKQEDAVLDPFMNLDILEKEAMTTSNTTLKKEFRKKQRRRRRRSRSEIPELSFSKKDKGRQLFVYWESEKCWFQGSVMTFRKKDNTHTIAFNDGDVKSFDLLREKVHFGVSPPDESLEKEEETLDMGFKMVSTTEEDDKVFETFRKYYKIHNPSLSVNKIKSLLHKHRTKAQLAILCTKIGRKYGERLVLDDDVEGDTDEDGQDEEDEFYNDDNEEEDDNVLHVEIEGVDEDEENLDDVAAELNVKSKRADGFYADDSAHFETSSPNRRVIPDVDSTASLTLTQVPYYFIGLCCGVTTSIVISLSCLLHSSSSFAIFVILTSWVLSLTVASLVNYLPRIRPTIYLFLSGVSLLCTWESSSKGLNFFLILEHVFFLHAATLLYARSENVLQAIDIGCCAGRLIGVSCMMYMIQFWSPNTVLFTCAFLPILVAAIIFWYFQNDLGERAGSRSGSGLETTQTGMKKMKENVLRIQMFWVS